MKKIYTLLSGLLLAGMATAQNFTVTYNGENVAENDVIDLYATEEDYGVVIVEAKSNPTSTTGLMLNNAKSTPVEVKATGTVVSSSAELKSYSLQLCMGGTCIAASGGVVSKSVDLTGSSVPFQYDVIYGDGQGVYGTVSTRMTLESGSQTLTFYVRFIYSDAASIGSTLQSGETFYYDNNTVAYAFRKAATRVAGIYTSSGILVRQERLAQQGTLSLDDLPTGVYVLTLKVDGRDALSRKLIVKE